MLLLRLTECYLITSREKRKSRISAVLPKDDYNDILNIFC
jgi:hypothetical protein